MEKWKLIEPVKGDHIRVKSNQLYHHGIYIGNDEVVQFGGPFDMFVKPKDIVVEKVHIEDFLKGGFLEVRILDRKEKKQRRSTNEIIETALSKLGEGGYDILYNNCEHFVNYCIFGVKKSTQVEDLHKEIREKLGKK